MTDGAVTEDLFEQRVGEQLAAERTRQKLELADIANRLRIPPRHLEAIEAGDYDVLPAIPYSAGFVKSYANMLGLDGIALSRAFREEVGNDRRAHFEPEAYEPVDPSRVPSRMLAIVALGVALLLGVGYLLLRFEDDRVDVAKLAADTPEEIAAPAQVAVPAAAAPAVVVPTGPIAVKAVGEDIWIKVFDRADGKVLQRGVIKVGESYVVPDSAVDPVLRILKPQLIQVLIGTTVLPPVGKPDELVPEYSLKREALVAIATAPPQLPAGDLVAGNAMSNATEPTPGIDPAGGRPDTTQPISPDQAPRRP